MSAEHEFEPVPGLPETLPEGESMLWQGKPGWRGVLTTIHRISQHFWL